MASAKVVVLLLGGGGGWAYPPRPLPRAIIIVSGRGRRLRLGSSHYSRSHGRHYSRRKLAMAMEVAKTRWRRNTQWQR
jgi:hypothetical protein